MNSLRTPLFSAAAAALALSAFAATHTVNVDDNNFSPSNLTICLGDTVTWNWVGGNGHSTTSGSGCSLPNGTWDSGVMGNGSTFSVTFTSIPAACATDNSSGDNTCSYYCIPHCSMMTGVISINDAPSGGVGISRSKLRVTSDPTQGRGGTILGVETLDGVTFNDVDSGTTTLMLTLSAPMLAPVSSTVSLSDVRGDFTGRFATNDSQPVSISTVRITGTGDVTMDKLTLKYETNGFDLTTVGPLTAAVTITHVVSTPGCGSVTVTSTGSSAVAQ